MSMGMNLKSENVNQLCFALDIPARRKERILEEGEAYTILWEYLRDTDELIDENVEKLESFLNIMDRKDLIHVTTAYRNTLGASVLSEDPSLEAAMDFISSNIGRDWIKLSRKLGLKDDDIDAVKSANLNDLNGACYNCLRRWREKARSTAPNTLTVETLENALRAIRLNHTADLMPAAIHKHDL